MARVCLVVIVAAVATAPTALADPLLEARFKNEAPRKWDELLGVAKRYAGRSTYQKYEAEKGRRKLLEHFTSEWKCAGDNALVTIRTYASEQEDSLVSEDVTAANPYYLFRLERRSANADWLLRDVELNPPAGEEAAVGSPPSQIRKCYRQFCAGLVVGERELPDVVGDPKYRFTVTGNVQPEPGNPALIRVPCAFVVEARNKRFTNSFKGFMVLDSERYWVPTRYEFDINYVDNPVKHSSHQVMECAYDTDNGVPILTSVTMTHSVPDEAGGVARQIEKVSRHSIRRAGRLDDADFRLSAYGLPEPVGVPVTGSSRLYLWLILSGILCLGLGLCFSWLIRRKRGAALARAE